MLLEGLLIGHLFLFQIRTVSKLFIGVFSFVDGLSMCGINHRRLKIEDRRKNQTTLA
jgi:hypothetical protein